MSTNISQSNQLYNTNNNLNNSIKTIFIQEGENLIGAARACEDLWEEMRRADFRKEGILNETNIEIIYKNKKKIINTLLKIQTAEEFIQVFDEDQDGFLNEDEQILVFTIIAKRIQLIAEELCELKKYELYKDLMREVRAIENSINRFQNDLRQNVHKKQLEDYINIGKEIQYEFDNNWDEKMDNFSEKEKFDIQNYEDALKKEIDAYYQNEAAKIHSIKLKPNHQIKLLNNQEKLVANMERVEEAINFRNELNFLQKKDEERLERTKKDMLKNLNNKIDNTELKEMKKITDRFDKERDKLIITRNKATDVLNKQINLHISDIVRIQNSISNMFIKIGANNDELCREKERKKKINETIAEFKSIKKPTGNPYVNSIQKKDIAMALVNLQNKTLTLNSSTESSGMNKFGGMKKNIIALKYMIKNLKLTRFDINNEFSNRKFCNVSREESVKNDNNLKRKIRTLIEQRKHKDEIMIPPSMYYDVNLENEIDAKNYKDLIAKIKD